MKNQIDVLMHEMGIDALLVTGAGDHNPFMVYFTGIAHLTQADLIKPRDRDAILFHASMERDEAARTGLTTRGYSEYPFKVFLDEAKNDPALAMAFRYKKMLTDVGVASGRVAVYGRLDLSKGYAFFSKLQAIMPEITLTGYQENDLLLQAMKTKDAAEKNRIRKMAGITTHVISRVADYLSNQRVKDSYLVNEAGYPVTIADVKSRINLWLAEAGAENPEGTIFAIGYDAGVPHSSGNPADSLRMGQTIVFDFFPHEAGGGYFYDITRTWSLGYATDEALKLYEDVLHVYNAIRKELRLGALCRDYQNLACDLFEKRGHPTLRSDPTTTDGYVHSLGHGVGLEIHEGPGLSARSQDVLEEGMVVTVEPGVYLPGKAGIRIEDTVVVSTAGAEILTEFPRELRSLR